MKGNAGPGFGKTNATAGNVLLHPDDLDVSDIMLHPDRLQISPIVYGGLPQVGGFGDQSPDASKQPLPPMRSPGGSGEMADPEDYAKTPEGAAALAQFRAMQQLAKKRAKKERAEARAEQKAADKAMRRAATKTRQEQDWNVFGSSSPEAIDRENRRRAGLGMPEVDFGEHSPEGRETARRRKEKKAEKKRAEAWLASAREPGASSVFKRGDTDIRAEIGAQITCSKCGDEKPGRCSRCEQVLCKDCHSTHTDKVSSH